jgi:hypothetical protein
MMHGGGLLMRYQVWEDASGNVTLCSKASWFASQMEKPLTEFFASSWTEANQKLDVFMGWETLNEH